MICELPVETWTQASTAINSASLSICRFLIAEVDIETDPVVQRISDPSGINRNRLVRKLSANLSIILKRMIEAVAKSKAS